MFTNNNRDRILWQGAPPPSLKNYFFIYWPILAKFDLFEEGGPPIIHFYLNYYRWTYENVKLQMSSKLGNKWRIFREIPPWLNKRIEIGEVHILKYKFYRLTIANSIHVTKLPLVRNSKTYRWNNSRVHKLGLHTNTSNHTGTLIFELIHKP